jgi:PAS domain S-box-containing protein
MRDPSGRGYAARVRRWLNRVTAREAQGADARELAARMDAQLERLRHAEAELKVQGEALRKALAQADRERRRYRELFHGAPVPYLTTTVEGRIRDINVEAARLLHLQPSQAPGKPLPAFVRDPAELRSRLARLARMEGMQDWSTEVVPRDGQPIPVEMSAAAVDAPDGEALEILWLLRDTRHERAAQVRERQLHQEQAARAAIVRVAERSRQLADMSGRLMGIVDPAAVWTTAATILEAQATAVALLEFEAGDGADPEVRVRGIGGNRAARRRLDAVLGRALDLARAAESLGIPVDIMVRIARGGEPEVAPSRDEAAAHIEGEAAPHGDGEAAKHGDGEAAGDGNAEAAPHGDGEAAEDGEREAEGWTGPALVVALRGRDSTLGAMVLRLGPDANVGEELLVNGHLSDRIALALETARLFQEVVLARRKAEEAGAAETDFLSMISHELRTPLTAMVSYAQLLEERVDELPGKLRRYAHQIAAAAHHQRELVEQVIAYQGLQRHPSGGDPEELDFRDVAHFAVGLVRPQVADRPIALEADLPDDPVRGTCDAGKLRQILANLLANALRHTEEGHVRLSLRPRGRWVEVRVEDTGQGIPPEELPRIYDRFWRGASARTHSGSGLGLTIVRELVTRMQGEIRVASQVGVGTTFTVRLPRQSPPRGAAGVLGS